MGLAAALRQLGRETAANVVLDGRAEKEAETEVTLQLEDVPLETAVRLLSEMAGLKPVRVGNTLFVTRKELAAAMRNDPDFAPPTPAAVSYINDFTPQRCIRGMRAPAAFPNPPFNGPGTPAIPITNRLGDWGDW